jgi:ribonucleotide reductase alpha subunit
VGGKAAHAMNVAALSSNALRVLEARYLRRDASRVVIETPQELFHRVARAVAQAELVLGTAREADRWQAIFHDLLVSLDFLPNSPTLMNAGTSLGQLSACFVPTANGIGDLRTTVECRRRGFPWPPRWRWVCT